MPHETSPQGESKKQFSKNDLLAEKFTPKTSKITKFRSRINIFKRTVESSICIDGDDSFDCKCFAGFTGQYCEVDINECGSNPCFNEGLCIDSKNSFNCECQPGFFGNFCESVENPCEILGKCLNSGTCIPASSRNGKDFKCACKPGFSGKTCDVDINECDSNPCFGHGFCQDFEDFYTCDCLDGYTGLRCETKVLYCDDETCENLGVCENLELGYECHCPPGFFGVDCGDAIDECGSNPCGLGATERCDDLEDSYSAFNNFCVRIRNLVSFGDFQNNFRPENRNFQNYPIKRA